MKLPSGYGSISKLSGKRRNPYMVRITTGYDDQGRQQFKIIGYVKTRKEGLELLASYHRDPDAVDSNITFEELYNMFIEKKEGAVSDSAMNGYKSAFKAASRIHKMKVKDIKYSHLEKIMEKYADASPNTRGKYKAVYTMIFDLAIQHDLVDKNYASYIEIGKTGTKVDKETYSDDDIKLLWEHTGDDFVDATLILLYTGMRIGELIDLKMDNIHLDEQYVIGGSKTEAGKNRTIALADKIMPIMKRLYGDGTKKQLILTPKGKTMTPATFKHYWRAKMQELGIERGLHEARHTCVSNLYKVGVAPEIIRKQVGHSGKSVTESVYLHIGVEQLLEAVNKLD